MAYELTDADSAGFKPSHRGGNLPPRKTKETETLLMAVEFSRSNFHFNPPLEEKVNVILEIPARVWEVSFEDATELDELAWDALAQQYPVWACPYHQGFVAPNLFEKTRHSFSSPLMGKTRLLSEIYKSISPQLPT